MDHYVVIGHPIAHSKSPQIHQAFAKQTQQKLIYTTIDTPVNRFNDTIKKLEAAGIKGCNITLPFKEAAYKIATQQSESAKQAGAANTFVFKNHEIYADSTDGPGLIKDIINNHHYSLTQKKILVIGGGGVVKCIVGPLLAQAPEQLIIANRTVKKAITIAQRFKTYGAIDGIGLQEIPQKAFDLIINATSASMTGERPLISNQLIGTHTLCYDLFYSDQLTPFLKWAKLQGARACIDGLGMLVEQAAMAFYLWRGVYPKTQPVISRLRSSLEK